MLIKEMVEITNKVVGSEEMHVAQVSPLTTDIKS